MLHTHPASPRNFSIVFHLVIVVGHTHFCMKYLTAAYTRHIGGKVVLKNQKTVFHKLFVVVVLYADLMHIITKYRESSMLKVKRVWH